VLLKPFDACTELGQISENMSGEDQLKSLWLSLKQSARVGFKLFVDSDRYF